MSALIQNHKGKSFPAGPEMSQPLLLEILSYLKKFLIVQRNIFLEAITW
jgi:hypothetical protein